MPPKVSKQSQPGKKAPDKKPEKVVVDKSFGLKNKKGAKQAKFIEQLQKQMKNDSKLNKPGESSKKQERDKREKEQKEMNLLFKPVPTQKIEHGVDPKSILCAFYKQGQCTKGEKCKFSHDLNIERKTQKRSMYTDMRDEAEDTMDKWDEKKLQEVVQKKHGEAEKKMPPTTIVCKYFLDAIESRKYGWFWQCPNGCNCIYRHALPPGFVLKNQQKEVDKEEIISLEDLVEKERGNLGSNLQKITLKTFIEWKKKKNKEKADKAEKLEETKRMDYKTGKRIGMSGRDLFTFDPTLAAADEHDEGDAVLEDYILNEDSMVFHGTDLQDLWDNLTFKDTDDISSAIIDETLFLEDSDFDDPTLAAADECDEGDAVLEDHILNEDSMVFHETELQDLWDDLTFTDTHDISSAIIDETLFLEDWCD